MMLCVIMVYKKKAHRNRTWSLRFRRPTPYQFGHAFWLILGIAMLIYFNIKLPFKDEVINAELTWLLKYMYR